VFACLPWYRTRRRTGEVAVLAVEMKSNYFASPSSRTAGLAKTCILPGRTCWEDLEDKENSNYEGNCRKSGKCSENHQTTVLGKSRRTGPKACKTATALATGRRPQ
jgi:hypothetical protein